ncbi:unnamed protein product [Rotaria sp. Silwood1]|nr:unnamed protein product [Rotaria sp. Silwood1]
MSLSSSDNNVFGHVAPGWESVRTKFEQNLTDGHDIGASLCVYHLGECVVNLIGGWKDAKTKKEPYTPDTLQLIFSTSKGVAAAAAALCVEKGWLDYQAPVAKYWPEFGVNGKENILVGDLLSHRAGLPGVDQQLTVNDVFDWGRITSLLAEQRPYWKPGSTHGYHAYTSGFLAGELIQRVDPYHRSYSQFVRDELDPEFYVGVSDDKVEARIAPLLIKSILVGDLLSHRAGLPGVDQQLTVNDVFDWGRITSLLAEQRPYWKPGSTHGYHAYTSGFLAGELIQRVDPYHRSYSQFVRDELDPEFYVGVSDDKVEARIAPLLIKVRAS